MPVNYADFVLTNLTLTLFSVLLKAAHKNIVNILLLAMLQLRLQLIRCDLLFFLSHFKFVIKLKRIKVNS